MTVEDNLRAGLCKSAPARISTGFVTNEAQVRPRPYCTISARARERLQQIQDLMRHRFPSGDPAAIVEHAFDVLHRELVSGKPPKS